jgi:hypothetical protein
MTAAASTIPENPDQVTDAWLTERLRESGCLRSGTVIHHESALLETQGAAGIVARITLTYDRAEAAAPRTLIAKFASPYVPIRTLMRHMGAYAREVEFYRHFGADPGIPTPACYHAEIDPEEGVFVLLLEDMSDARVMEGASLPIEDLELAVRHLAPFHARWWNHPSLRELAFLRYPGCAADQIFMAQAREALRAALPAARERYGDGVPRSLVEMAEGMLGGFDAMLERRTSETTGAVTLVHGDFHPGQIFFPSGHCGRFAVFDWQTVSAGNGGDDLARIIVSGLEPEQRRAHDHRLIALYHRLLVEHGVRDFDLERCYHSFRLGLIANAIINLIAAVNIDPAFIETMATDGVSVTDAMFGWVADAAEEHDVMSALAP